MAAFWISSAQNGHFFITDLSLNCHIVAFPHVFRNSGSSFMKLQFRQWGGETVIWQGAVAIVTTFTCSDLLQRPAISCDVMAGRSGALPPII